MRRPLYQAVRLILCLFLFLSSQTISAQGVVDEQVLAEVQPYLLPDDHPIKTKLDEIFSKRPTASPKAMKKAGFKMILSGHKRKVVASHKKLKGYLIKTYLDVHYIETEDWQLWIHRIKGAAQIDASIKAHGYEHIMKVPKKWIYRLPTPKNPAALSLYPKNFILVVEDMNLVSRDQNKMLFFTLSREQMDAIYMILSENLLHDSIWLHNIPFSKDGRISFIDTEHFASTSRPVRYQILTRHFNPSLQDYWRELTASHSY